MASQEEPKHPLVFPLMLLPVSQLPAWRSKPKPAQLHCSCSTCSPAKLFPLSLACRAPARGAAPDPVHFLGGFIPCASAPFLAPPHPEGRQQVLSQGGDVREGLKGKGQ